MKPMDDVRMPEWDAYAISVPGSPPGGPDGWEFDLVHHVAHLRQSRRILEDGCLRAGLVNDGSRLDTSRTCVNFLSPNTWDEGSIYGNVVWSYRWDLLVRGRNLHWVEARTDYKYPICRFLVSDRPTSAFPYLTFYDPVTAFGPVRLLSGRWYRNPEVVSEFLFEGDLPVDDCARFGFVRHHAEHCRGGGPCPDKGFADFWASAQTMAFVFGSDVRGLDAVMRRAPRNGSSLLHDVVKEGLNQFLLKMTMVEHEEQGTVEDVSDGAALVRGAMALLGTGQVDRALDLTRPLKDKSVLRAAIETIVDDHFGIEGWSLFEGKPALQR